MCLCSDTLLYPLCQVDIQSLFLESSLIGTGMELKPEDRSSRLLIKDNKFGGTTDSIKQYRRTRLTTCLKLRY